MGRSHPAGILTLAAVALAAAAVWLAVDPVGEGEDAGRRAPRNAGTPATAPPTAAPPATRDGHVVARMRPEPDAPAAGGPAEAGRDPAGGVRAPSPAAGGPTRSNPPVGVLAALTSMASAPDDLLGIAAPRSHPVPARPPASLVVALAQAAVPPDELVGIATGPLDPRPATRAEGGAHPPPGVVAAVASVPVSVDGLLAVSVPAQRPAPPRPVDASPAIPSAGARGATPTAAPPPPPAKPVAAALPYVTGHGDAPGPVAGRLDPRARAATGAFRRTAWPVVDGGPSGIPLVRPRAEAATGEGEARPTGRDGARAGIPTVLAITGDDELVTILGHRDPGSR